MKKMKNLSLLLIFLLLLTDLGYAQEETVYAFREGFSIPLVGKYGRDAIYQDELLYKCSVDSFDAPSEAKIFSIRKLSDTIRWEKLNANEKGWFQSKNLRGGYLVCDYTSKRGETLILKANGHSEVYINGEPRGGDVYGYGWIEHPVYMKKGVNRLVFKGARGRIMASLVKPMNDIYLTNQDMLLPDLLVADSTQKLGAIRVINTTQNTLWGYTLQTTSQTGTVAGHEIPPIGPLTSRKVPFMLSWDSSCPEEEMSVKFHILNSRNQEVFTLIEQPVVKILHPTEKHKVTFLSTIDGSVQYYSVVPPIGEFRDSLAMFFSLHGASVEAVNQANAYAKKDWGVLVAPTNRRPYGFDWEDWGRWDAQEVLQLATAKYNPDASKLFLTGHSMGGHGTWHLGVTFPGIWAAIAPSAGWYSFWSYAGKESSTKTDPIAEILEQSSNASHTLGLSENFANYGVYILHGDQDDNVPVDQARFMRNHLGSYHPDFAYYERPGAGHWWGNECVDWPPLFDFFQSHKQQELHELTSFTFTTASPGVSSRFRHIEIVQQREPLQLSKISYEHDMNEKVMRLTTDNVRALSVSLAQFPVAQPYVLFVDSVEFKVVAGEDQTYAFVLQEDEWSLQENFNPITGKHPNRNGLFKDAFRNDMIFVYGTKGTREENKWAYNKARFDAETFWYRGNGSVDVISDADFQKADYSGRNVILYGHADMNSAWNVLLENCPIHLSRGKLTLGNKVFEGEQFGAYFIYPMTDSPDCSVGVVAGTGLRGMTVANANRYFVSGSGFPDFMIFDHTMLRYGISGVLSAGFFNNNWELEENKYHIR